MFRFACSASVKRLAGKIVSEMTGNLSSGNPTQLNSFHYTILSVIPCNDDHV